jgi:hypothetical protein
MKFLSEGSAKLKNIPFILGEKFVQPLSLRSCITASYARSIEGCRRNTGQRQIML